MNAVRHLGVDPEILVVEDGQSSNSVTEAGVSNSNGPPQDLESSDTSLKLGYPHCMKIDFTLFSSNVYLDWSSFV